MKIVLNESNNTVEQYDPGDRLDPADWPQGDSHLYTPTVDGGTVFTDLSEVEAYNIDDQAKTCNLRNKTKYYLEVTTDAVDSGAPIDGIPDIVANGVSTCTITVKKKDKNGDVVTDATDTISAALSNGGSLDSYSKALVSGEITFTLTSEAQKKITEVHAAVDGASDIESGFCRMQFK